MKKKFEDINFLDVTTYSIKDRSSKVSITDICSPVGKGLSFQDFLSSLPNILAAKDLKEVAGAIGAACKKDAVVAIGIGAHVIKVGLGPLLIDFMKKGLLSLVAGTMAVTEGSLSGIQGRRICAGRWWKARIMISQCSSAVK